MTAPAFPILVYDTQATSVLRGDLSPLVYQLRISTTLPGGCGTCSFRLRAPTNVVPDYLNFNYEVRLGDRGEIFWSGRMEDIIAHRGEDGEYWDVTAYGYGVNLEDQVYTSQDVSNTVTSTVALNALTQAPQIDASTLTASGFTISAATAVNLKLLTMAQVVNWAAHFGLVTSFTPYVWYVYPDADGTVRFTFDTRPTAAAYLMRSTDCELVEFGLIGRRLANRVVAQYNDGAANVTVNDTALQAAGPDGWNLIRTLREFVPEVTQSADATQVANALLTKYKRKTMAARTIRLRRGAFLLDSNTIPVEPWRVRAGSLAQFIDVDPSEGTGLTFTNSFLIQETEWDQDAQSLRIVPEHRDLTPNDAFAQLFSVLGGRHTMQAR